MKVVLIIKNVCCNLYITIYIVYKDTIGVRRCHNWCHYFQVTSCQKHVSGVLKPKTDRTEQNRPHFTEDTIQMFLEHWCSIHLLLGMTQKLLQSMKLLEYKVERGHKLYHMINWLRSIRITSTAVDRDQKY